MIQIPVFQNQTADFEMTIDLDNVSTKIRLVFNIRTETWNMRLTTPNASIQGIKLVKQFPLLERHKGIFYELPGDFLVLKLSDDITDPDLDYDNLGVFWALFYLTEAEVEAWRTENGI